jgi:hypothetical protein
MKVEFKSHLTAQKRWKSATEEDDGPTLAELHSGESGEEVTQDVHFNTEYATGFEVMQLFSKDL